MGKLRDQLVDQPDPEEETPITAYQEINIPLMSLEELRTTLLKATSHIRHLYAVISAKDELIEQLTASAVPAEAEDREDFVSNSDAVYALMEDEIAWLRSVVEKTAVKR